MTAWIFGAGAQGRVILDILRAQGRHDSFGFIDDNPEMRGRQINGAPVECGLEEALGRARDVEMIVALGDPDIRCKLARRIAACGVPLLNAVHPSAVIMPTAVLGRGIMIAANVVINSNASIADNVNINTGAVVEHDCIVEEGAAVGPGATLGGRVKVGPAAFISLGAILISRVSVGARTVVGAGAVVTRDLPEQVLGIGVPARVVENLGPQFNWSRVL